MGTQVDMFQRKLPSKFNTAKHTVVEKNINSNTNLQLHKQETICKGTVQYDHIRNKINDDSNLSILPLICKNIQTCNNY